MIREGLIQSDSVNALTWQAEVFFVRLMLKADDFGRYSADTRLVRAALFPLRLDQVRETDVSRWIAECVKAKLVRLYIVDGKPYLEIPKFDQRMRAKKSRFPPSDGHMADTCQTDGGHMLPEVEVEVEVEGTPPDGGHVAVIRPPGDRFEEFWAGYSKKAGRAAAARAWKKLSDADRDLAIAKAPLYCAAMADRPEFIKHAQGWLNDKRWEDDPATWRHSVPSGNGARPPGPPALNPTDNEARRRKALGLPLLETKGAA